MEIALPGLKNKLYLPTERIDFEDGCGLLLWFTENGHLDKGDKIVTGGVPR
jgi:hypothetical protein